MLVAATTFAVFLPSIANGWADFQDDGINFLQNEAYRGLGPRQLLWSFETFLLGVYQPLAWILFEVQYVIFGMMPAGYHLTSVLLHAFNAFLLTVLLAAILQRYPSLAGGPGDMPVRVSAAFSALLFSVHPLRVETVAWVSCQPYLPCAGFAMLSTLVYLYRDGTRGPRRFALLAAATVLYIASVLCKAASLPLPFVFLILDAFPLRRFSPAGGASWPSIRTAVLEKLPLALAALFFLAVTFSAKYTADPVITSLGGGLARRFLHTGYAIFFYLEKTLLPWNLAALYEAPGSPMDQPLLLGGALATLCLSVLSFFRAPALARTCRSMAGLPCSDSAGFRHRAVQSEHRR